MLKVNEKGTNRLDIELHGKLNAASMKLALDPLVSKSENIENGKMLPVSWTFNYQPLAR